MSHIHVRLQRLINMIPHSSVRYRGTMTPVNHIHSGIFWTFKLLWPSKQKKTIYTFKLRIIMMHAINELKLPDCGSSLSRDKASDFWFFFLNEVLHCGKRLRCLIRHSVRVVSRLCLVTVLKIIHVLLSGRVLLSLAWNSSQFNDRVWPHFVLTRVNIANVILLKTDEYLYSSCGRS